MKPRATLWRIYLINENLDYVLKRKLRSTWPSGDFEKYAKANGYTLLRSDDTLMGGYYAAPNGDTLVCVPAALDPRSIYGGKYANIIEPKGA